MINVQSTHNANSKFKILLSEGSAKVQRRMSEGWAKESRRAGTAEYVKPMRLALFSRHYHIKK